MRLVRWTPQERVDIPDLTAVSFLVLGETRRWSRSVILGEDAANYILQGFAVEPAAVPDSTIRVRLDPSGTGTPPFGQALGGENLGGTTVRHGQLIGDHDDAANLEGNAIQTFDFSAQPANTYRLQMRFVFADGVNDNRAFWNASTDAEFISAVDTRHLPNYQLGIAVSPASLGAEYIPLADVVWVVAGTVTSSEITDVRKFAFEGAAPFDAATQAAYAALPDFSRSTDRAANGQNAVYPALRALGRQIADLKGQNDLGVFDYFSRTFKPPGGGTFPGGTEQTRSLRAQDTVTFTVSDGSTDYGDFNGLTGLNDCLQYIDTNQAALPDHIQIVIKSRETAADTPAFTLSASTNITDKHLRIIGQSMNGRVEGRVRVTANHATFNAIALSGDCSLWMENIEITVTTANASGIFVDPITSHGCTLINCKIVGDILSATTGFCARASSRGLYWRNCDLQGRIEIGGASSGLTRGGEIIGCAITETALQLFNSVTFEITAGLAIRNCKIAGNTTAPYTAQPLGAVQTGGSFHVVFENCDVFWHGDTNGIYVGSSAIQVAIKNCSFTQNVAATHAVDAGATGVDGTSFGIFCAGANPRQEDTFINNCSFLGYLTVDGGGIFAEDVLNLTVSNCRTERVGPLAATNRFTALRVQGSVSTFETNAKIIGNVFGEWNSAGDNDLRAIDIANCRHVVISGNTLDGRDNLSASIAHGATYGALRLSSVQDVRVVNNQFISWGTTLPRCVLLAGPNTGLQFVGNIARNNIDWFVQAISGASVNSVFNDNYVSTTSAGDGGIDISPAGNAGWSFVGNQFDFAQANDAISLGANLDMVLSGNNCSSGVGLGVIRRTGGPGPLARLRGFNETNTNPGTAVAVGELNLCTYA